jgi:hypothetical protein
MNSNPPRIHDRCHNKKRKEKQEEDSGRKEVKKGIGKKMGEENGSGTFKLPGRIHIQIAADRDWYDLVWYAANYPQLHLKHLEERMRQSGHWQKKDNIGRKELSVLLAAAVERLDVEQAKRDILPFIADSKRLDVWSVDFFKDIFSRILLV